MEGEIEDRQARGRQEETEKRQASGRQGEIEEKQARGRQGEIEDRKARLISKLEDVISGYIKNPTPFLLAAPPE